MPWAEPGSQFTALFEALAINWLQQASVSAVAKHLRIRGTRRPASSRARSSAGSPVARRCRPGTWGVDETSFQKRHEYVTVVSNLERAQVLHVADDRTIATLVSSDCNVMVRLIERLWRGGLKPSAGG